MSATLAPLILDFLQWVAAGPHPYAEVMDRWRTSCPRLTVWEDTVDGGLVAIHQHGDALVVEITQAGRDCLRQAGRHP